ncbi:MAG: hypothetical protein RRY78_01495 [Clostridia bacterium]
MAKKRKTVTVSLSKKSIIAIVAIILIVAIVCGVLWFTAPPFKDFVIKIFNSGGESENGGLPTKLEGDVVQMHFVDVGQGDCIILRFPDGKDMIIDAGSGSGGTENDVKNRVLDYCKRLEIDYFDYMMLTHTDADHAGVLDEVIKEYDVREFFLPDLDASYNEPDTTKKKDGKVPTKTYFDVVAGAKAETYTDNGVQKQAVINKNIDEFKIVGVDYQIDFYCFTAEMYDKITYGDAEEINSVSPIGILSFGGRKVVLTGDANTITEEYFLKNHPEGIDCDVLKAGHHGSKGSTTEAFLHFVDVEYVVVMAGKDNSYGHPHDEFIKRVNEYKETNNTNGDYETIQKTYITFNDGSILLQIAKNGGIKFDTKIFPYSAENLKAVVSAKINVYVKEEWAYAV